MSSLFGLLCGETASDDWWERVCGVTRRAEALVESILFQDAAVTRETVITLFDHHDESLFFCIKNPINVLSAVSSHSQILSRCVETGFTHLAFLLVEILLLNNHVTLLSLLYPQLALASSHVLFSLLIDFASDCVTNAVDVSIPLQTTLIVVFVASRSCSDSEGNREFRKSGRIGALRLPVTRTAVRLRRSFASPQRHIHSVRCVGSE